MRLLDN